MSTRDLQDHYFREAKRAGYLSRAAYKLREIDDRKKILRKGDRVLDCGAAPGSWLQVAAERVGPRGCVVGVDLQAITHQFHDKPVTVLEGDLAEIEPARLLEGLSQRKQDGTGGPRFDVILSDMAPRTTGDHTIDHHASARLGWLVLGLCPALLRSGGNMAIKVFEGATYRELLDAVAASFESTRGFVPKASRSESREIYIVAHGYKAGAATGDAGDEEDAQDEMPLAPPRPKPRPGWSS